jgi:hypothetical protein
MRTTEFRATPASAIIPIIAVAVKRSVRVIADEPIPTVEAKTRHDPDHGRGMAVMITGVVI